jgi:hypothetical protein
LPAADKVAHGLRHHSSVSVSQLAYHGLRTSGARYTRCRQPSSLLALTGARSAVRGARCGVSRQRCGCASAVVAAQNSGDPAEFWPQSPCAFELRWTPRLGNSLASRIDLAPNNRLRSRSRRRSRSIHSRQVGIKEVGAVLPPVTSCVFGWWQRRREKKA